MSFFRFTSASLVAAAYIFSDKKTIVCLFYFSSKCRWGRNILQKGDSWASSSKTLTRVRPFKHEKADSLSVQITWTYFPFFFVLHLWWVWWVKSFDSWLFVVGSCWTTIVRHGGVWTTYCWCLKHLLYQLCPQCPALWLKFWTDIGHLWLFMK